jgi:hypothetical protein
MEKSSFNVLYKYENDEQICHYREKKPFGKRNRLLRIGSSPNKPFHGQVFQSQCNTSLISSIFITVKLLNYIQTICIVGHLEFKISQALSSPQPPQESLRP